MKKAIIRSMALACLIGTLAGCGGGGGDDGGGGGGDNSPAPQSAAPQTVTGPSWVTFSPNRIDLNVHSFTRFSFEMTSSRVIDDVFSIRISNDKGDILSSVSIDEVREGTLKVELTTSALSRGEHSGVFKIELCDGFDYWSCSKPLDAPWFLPYRFVAD